MGKVIRRVFASISFILAVIMTLSGVVGYFIMSSEADAGSSLREVQKEFAESDRSRQDRIDNATYDEDVGFARGSDIAEAKKHYHSTIEEYGIGSIYMPQAGISVPILAGTSEWNLFNGVGTERPDQELGEGLFIALSHNLANKRLLNDIDRMSAGDYIYASDFTNVYVYQVIDQKVVHETNNHYFKEPEEGDSSKMLLYRCEGRSGTDWRRALYSEFIESKPVSAMDIEILQGLDIEVEEVDVTEEVTVEPVEIEEVTDDTFIEKWVGKFVEFIGQYKELNDYFLSVYSIADNHPIIFGMIAVMLFVLYGIL